LSHYVDLTRWWVGAPVTEVYSACAPNVVPYTEVRDNYHTTYRFENGAVSHLTFLQGPAHTYEMDPLQSVAHDRFDYREVGHKLIYTVVGTEGALESSIFDRSLKVYEHAGKSGHRGNSRLVRVERWKKEEDQIYSHNTRDQNVDIARRALEGRPPAIDPEDAAETMRLCFEFEGAAESGWRIVERS